MKEIDVVGAIIVKNNTVLCAKRGQSKSLGGFWEFPGGKIEIGETPKEALARELTEELNIKVILSNRYFKKTTYTYDFGIVTLTTYICHLEDGEPILNEHEEIKWVIPEQIDQLKWAPADIPAVRKLKDTYLKGVYPWSC